MAKIVLSSHEFDLLTSTFQAPKEGKHIKWRDFCDAVDEVFTKKHLEKNIDIPIDDVRTHTIYGRSGPSKYEQVTSEDIVGRFRVVL